MEISSLLKENIAKAVKNLYGVVLPDIHLEHPENDKWGDYATNVAMGLAKTVKQPPMEIAKNVCYEIQSFELYFRRADSKYPIFEKIEVASPGFINFVLSKEWLHNVLYNILESANSYGSAPLGEGKTVLVEYSQPNPNKPMHIGHARNNFLGSSIAKIHSFLGYNTVSVNYMNDWGTHICKSMLMYKKHFLGQEPDKKPDHYVGDLYVLYETELESNPALAEELAGMFRDMEAGDPKTLEIWKKIVNWAYEGWKQTYADQNVSFDVWMYQSNYTSAGKEIVNIALERGIAEKDGTGAVIARLEKYGIPDKVLLRRDGTSLYSTQDLQLAKDSYEKYKFEKRLYVVDFRQSDYFRQIFKVLEILGFDWAKKLFHVSYGVVELPEGKMSSRKGLVVNSDDVYAQLVALELDEVSHNLKDPDLALGVAKKVALAAFRYGMLKVDPSQDIVFDYSTVSRFDGNTGPYLMYTYARAVSILDKSDFVFDQGAFEYDVHHGLSSDPKEEAVLREVYFFSEVVEAAGASFAPSLVANYLFSLAQKYNAFYATSPILTMTNKEVRTRRLLISKAVSQVLRNGLDLLGIEVVERM